MLVISARGRILPGITLTDVQWDGVVANDCQPGLFDNLAVTGMHHSDPFSAGVTLVPPGVGYVFHASLLRVREDVVEPVPRN